VPLAASSASDAWIFPGHLTHIGIGYVVYNSALHWNGTAWHAYSFPVKLILQAAAALGPADAWAFGLIGPRLDTVIPYAVRYDGRAWHRVRLPIAPLAVIAAGRDSLWVIGPTVATAGQVAGWQVIIAMHWNGRSWIALAVPKIAIPAGQSSFDATSVAAAGPHGFWWYYQAASQNNRAWRNGLERWNGTTWHAIALPGAISRVEAMTQDGHGGIWLTADLDINHSLVQYWYHYNGGRWTRQLVSAPRGYDDIVFGMAWIPGTTSVWADGEADPNSSGHAVGVIAKYGP
jgi:hypothetical protein